MRLRRFALFLGVVAVLALPDPRPLEAHVEDRLPTLPRVWHTVWSDAVSVGYLRELKAMGFDGLFKCVSFAPWYPNPPVYAGGEWRLVERVEGQYDWSSLNTCLENALRANMWFIPEVVVNVPPEWFVERYPGSLLEDSRGITNTDLEQEGAPYLLSPWFVATGAADGYLQPFVESFLSLVSQYPNVPAVMIGSWKLNVLPWKMGTDDEDDFAYWPIWDDNAKASYAARFGGGELPPATWDDYLALPDQEAFRDWLTAPIETNLQARYVPWLSGFDGWKVITASIWAGDDNRPSIFTTGTPEMVTSKQAAIAAAGVPGIIIDDDNMGGCTLWQYQQMDIVLAHANGFLAFGERVPDVCTWAEVFAMWQGLDPRPDGFINIGERDAYWIGQFRSLYGPPTEPLAYHWFTPLVVGEAASRRGTAPNASLCR